MPNSAISFNTAGLATTTSPGLVGTGAQTFAGAKTFSNGVEFTAASLSDVQATRLGLKQYLHGTTYNGGNAPTVTCTQAGFSVWRALFIPYQMQDLSWRLKFTISCVFTSASVNQINVNINGILFKNVGSFGQACAGLFGSNSNGVRCFVSPNTNTVSIQLGSVGTADGYFASGDVELDAKPTWAY